MPARAGAPARRARQGVVACVALGAVAPTALSQTDSVPGVAIPIAVTTHRITVSGKPLAYTARAGMLPIRDNEDAEPRAYVFFVAYTVERAPGGPPRPLTFAWNGGPGSNSLLLHLSALGPRRLAVDTSGSRARVAMEDNPATWLDETDLVFVDPVGTGFSRPARPEHAQAFYSVLGDIAATAEFIRVYRTRFDAWDAPLYLAGESYGVWRAAGVAEAMEKAGQRVAGVILISGGIPVGPVVSDAMRAALFIPTRTASAFFHQKLPADLQTNRERALAEAERWATTVYAPALARRDSLSATERSAIVAPLARFTGLDARLIDRKTLVVDRQFLLETLLKDRKQGALGRFDTRQVAGAVPADAGRDAAERTSINRYLRGELAFRTDLVYQGLERGYSSVPNQPGVNARWNYDQGDPNAAAVARNTDGPPGGTPPWLRRAMAIDPQLRAFVAAGMFDSLNSCTFNAYLVSQLPPAERERITPRCYEGGHMMYEDREAAFALRRDVGRFYDAGRADAGSVRAP